MSDSVRPHRWLPTRLPCPWDPPGKNTGVGCHFLLQCCVRLLATPGTAAYQAPPSMGFSRQEYWSGVPLPSPDLLNYKLWVNVHNLNFNKPSRYSWVKALKDSPKYLFLLYGKGTFTRVTTHMGKGHTRFSGTQTLSRCYSLGISKMLLLFSTNLSEGFLGIRRFKKLWSVDAQN